ncbi:MULTISPECIES: TetR/AcrR family transcriptional regulator [Aestuariibaculum]|uniref:TetR/AcrR family transcriptional regulator n=1 Tax=Aestuariibaculum lutulentum TaxID=2920935 RepID=A0ABS9RKD2_9FLAO|nr:MULTISPECIES: TetR/AcrR family transcriptional regulator [Aestuariibaculum]MCH4553416.1 TetR/AcrR family transcriptional regulator [Aestuariibaculum lutulentum]MCR8667844.1 TetR/AcrR family transcriptional regulator [Aestuariibaculum sp. M13]
MINLLQSFKIEVPKGIFIKDPETSDLGKRIIKHSILLIDELGFELFTFKKLGVAINSNESSIYRYFESKHHLLMYLTSWYWVWIEYQLVLETFALKHPEEKLKKSIEVLTRTTEEDSNFEHINEVVLNKIIISENAKAYLTCDVDSENEEGFFKPFKRVVTRFSEIIQEYNKNYTYSISLASSTIEGALHQHFFQQHIKSITNCNKTTSVTEFYTNLIFNTLKHGE